MISKVIYFIDDWLRANIGAQSGVLNAEMLARRCIDDAEKAGFTSEQIEADLGTDLVDFFTGELEARQSPWHRRHLPADVST
jgi:hypothetical protein